MKQLDEYTWPSGYSVEFALVKDSVGKLAEKPSVEHWIEWEKEGLGPARGFLVELDSGLIIGLYELKLAPEEGQGTIIVADAGVVGDLGPRLIIDGVLKEFGIPAVHLKWLYKEVE